MTFSELFIDVKSLPDNNYGLFQLLCIALTYGYILCYASNLISDGSELLLLVPAFANIVGSVVLPVLGAVPDGCIVLFSGLGENAQDTLNVGVGALVGSTIMLLTVPWFLSIIGGRVMLENGTARYKTPKLTPPNYISLFETGVAISPLIRTGSYIMLLTSIPYLLLQLPGLYYTNMSVAQQAVGESKWALFGLAFCVASFIGYLLYQYTLSDESTSSTSTARDEALIRAINENNITIMALVHSELVNAGVSVSRHGNNSVNFQSESSPMQPNSIPDRVISRLEKFLLPYFRRYDTDESGLLDTSELSFVLRDLGEKNIEQARDIIRVFGSSPVTTPPNNK